MPAPSGRSAELTLSPDVSSASAARRFVTATLEAWQLDHLVDDAILMASELVTNGLLHARTELRLRLSTGDGELLVEVRDASTVPVTIRNFSVESGTGRGLRLVGRMADAWGVEPGPDGKTVWFTLPLTGRPHDSNEYEGFDAVEAL